MMSGEGCIKKIERIHKIFLNLMNLSILYINRSECLFLLDFKYRLLFSSFIIHPYLFKEGSCIILLIRTGNSSQKMCPFR
jgi:hypothetical protein